MWNTFAYIIAFPLPVARPTGLQTGPLLLVRPGGGGCRQHPACPVWFHFLSHRARKHRPPKPWANLTDGTLAWQSTLLQLMALWHDSQPYCNWWHSGMPVNPIATDGTLACLLIVNYSSVFSKVLEMSCIFHFQTFLWLLFQRRFLAIKY